MLFGEMFIHTFYYNILVTGQIVKPKAAGTKITFPSVGIVYTYENVIN